ncbi:TPA: hypothetical protein L6796_004893, partial [Escherichia coli]|nr:hypothetical protein [Escherichia coli]
NSQEEPEFYAKKNQIHNKKRHKKQQIQTITSNFKLFQLLVFLLVFCMALDTKNTNLCYKDKKKYKNPNQANFSAINSHCFNQI